MNILSQVKNYSNEKLVKTIHNWIDKKEIEINLSGQADIYAYIFLHTATLLSDNGTFGIVTSNSWLDVSYGSVLKEFFLKHFKIKMVVASWAEPWFEDAAVNTVFTILEKEPEEKARNENIVRFVKLKKKLSELIPYHDLKLESSNRWKKLDSLIRIIETAEYSNSCKDIGIVPLKDKKEYVDDKIKSFEDTDFRIRLLSQSALKNETDENKELSKWIKFLRAPDVYFDIIEKCKDKLIPLKQIASVRRGYTTGINDFFHLEKINEIDESIICKNARDWEGKIEKEFLNQIIKSPKDSACIKVNAKKLKYNIFICNKSIKDLKKDKHEGALKYIQWGESQRTKENITFPNVETVKNRLNWYGLEIKEFPDAMWPKAFNDSYTIFKNDGVLVGDRLYEISFNKKKDFNKKLAILNSTLLYLFIEINGRINLGEGALDNMTYESEDCLIVNPDSFKTLDININNLFERKCLKISEEIKQKDRKELDTFILKSIGLNPKDYLPKIYDGICEMVKERTELPKMRKVKQKQTIKIAYNQIKESVIIDIIPDGIKRFPEAFYLYFDDKFDKTYKNLPSDFSKVEFESIPTTGKPLKYEHFLGQFTLKDEDGKMIHQFDSELKAQYAKIINKFNIYQLKIPKDERVVEIIITHYKNYIEELKGQLEANSKQKLHDQSTAEQMTDEILKDYNISINL
jgi:hypothetical protein